MKIKKADFSDKNTNTLSALKFNHPIAEMLHLGFEKNKSNISRNLNDNGEEQIPVPEIETSDDNMNSFMDSLRELGFCTMAEVIERRKRENNAE